MKITVSIILGLISLTLHARETVNTVNIVGDATRAVTKCAHYRVKGFCSWITWKKSWWFKYPRYSQTAYVSHYQPDVVVLVFPDKHKHPWKEMRVVQKGHNKLGKIVARRVLDGSLEKGLIQGQVNSSQNIRFKEASVIGHPFSISFPGKLPSQATPLFPHYSSQSDASLWRSPKAEMITHAPYLIPGVKEVGLGFLSSWGPLFPRTGFVNQIDDAKSAAVLALRALHIASTTNYHVSDNLTRHSCGQYCQGPGEMTHDSDIYFQMILPEKEKLCHKLIEGLEPEWLNQTRQNNGSYAWAVWRKYVGCKDGDGKRIACVKW